MKITELLIQDCVICPATENYVYVADCADYCDHYEGDGKETKYMKCSYEKTSEQIKEDKESLERFKIKTDDIKDAQRLCYLYTHR